MKRDQRINVVVSGRERWALRLLADAETLSSSAVVRRLIIREAKVKGVWLEADTRAKGENK